MNYQNRKNAVLKKMTQENADWFFVTNLTNVQYLSGFTGSHAVLMLHPDRQYILTDGRYSEQVVKQVKEYEIIIQGTRKEHEAMKDTVGDISNELVWFESTHCSYDIYETLKEKLSIQNMIGQKDIIEPLRAVKDDEEIACIKKALTVAETALEKAIGQIQEGMTERELAHILEHEMWSQGAPKESFESLILFGPHSSLCHGRPSDTRLQKGDTVLMDFGCVIDGYCSDITRTVFFGTPSDELIKMYACVLEANQNAEEHIQAGTTGKQADLYAREIIQKAGREKQFVHGLGHGVGLEIHEDPRLSYLSEHTLQEGNVVTVEPGVYVQNLGGIRIEDMIVVRKDGCELLNRFPKDMIIV
jgi:Xaa-Pro aminopeptidase